MDETKLKKLCSLVRYNILTSTTAAGSGHPTSSLSSVELATSLFFNGLYKEHDRFILSKGHASPLLYSLYHVGGLIDYKELMTLRKFGSRLEGHPNPRLPFVDVATGSLGQGLSVGIGMALGLKLRLADQHLSYLPKVWVLLGDSEMAEGQIWEAMEVASYHKLNNLVGIIDVNRLGQHDETIAGWDIYYYEKKAKAFGWEPIIVKDGHDLEEIYKAFNKVSLATQFSEKIAFASKPKMIIAKTIKGKGVSFLENKNGWHGKALSKEELRQALEELGKVDLKVRGKINIPGDKRNVIGDKRKVNKKVDKILTILQNYSNQPSTNHLSPITSYSTREAYGDTLVKLGEENPNIVVLDAEVSNSTYQNKFAKNFPERFFQMFIAEQSMVSVALGLQKVGFIPFLSTFAAFFTRAFDQIRMAQYSKANLKIVGSHAGVSIGQDGPSQMGLEDIAMFRSILDSVIFYPSDSVSTKKLTKLMADIPGIVYMRTTRGKTPVIYNEKEKFEIAGFKIHPATISHHLSPTTNHLSPTIIIAAGITLHEALKAQKELSKERIETTVVDLYCVKPLSDKLINFIKKFKNIIVVEDHYPAGGIGEAISSLLTTYHLSPITNSIHLCAYKTPMSGTPEELLEFEEIDEKAIVKAVLSCQKR